jgi:hypothetical protein
MPVKPCQPSAPLGKLCCELEALRAELRCILQHPAITPERQQAAEPHIRRCTEAARLGQWLALAVAECGHWEEQTLAARGALEGDGYLPG